MLIMCGPVSGEAQLATMSGQSIGTMLSVMFNSAKPSNNNKPSSNYNNSVSRLRIRTKS